MQVSINIKFAQCSQSQQHVLVFLHHFTHSLFPHVTVDYLHTGLVSGPGQDGISTWAPLTLLPPPPSPTDIIGANVTEFSLDRPQRSWPMQLEGLGSRLVGIGISDNWQPIESKREMAGFREPHFGGIQNFTRFHHSIHETIEFPS